MIGQEFIVPIGTMYCTNREAFKKVTLIKGKPPNPNFYIKMSFEQGLLTEQVISHPNLNT